MDITRRLRGSKVCEASSNGHILVLRLEDGSEIQIIWTDDNGNVLKGRPVLLSSGARLIAKGVHELIHLPGAMRQ